MGISSINMIHLVLRGDNIQCAARTNGGWSRYATQNHGGIVDGQAKGIDAVAN